MYLALEWQDSEQRCLVTPWKSVAGGCDTVVTPVQQGEFVFVLPGPDLEEPGLDWSGLALAFTKLTLTNSWL